MIRTLDFCAIVTADNSSFEQVQLSTLRYFKDNLVTWSTEEIFFNL